MGSQSNSRLSVVRRFRRHLLIGLLAILTSGQSFATSITYEATQLSGNTWRYDYTVDNDTLGAAIGELTFYFGLGDYANLGPLAMPSGWDGFIAQPDPLLPDDGFIDLLALDGGLAPGQSLGGFSIVFNWLAAGTPGSQPFDIIEAISFTTLESSSTALATPATPVPEPPALLLFLIGLLSFAWLRRRHTQVEVRANA